MCVLATVFLTFAALAPTGMCLFLYAASSPARGRRRAPSGLRAARQFLVCSGGATVCSLTVRSVCGERQ